MATAPNPYYQLVGSLTSQGISFGNIMGGAIGQYPVTSGSGSWGLSNTTTTAVDYNAYLKFQQDYQLNMKLIDNQVKRRITKTEKSPADTPNTAWLERRINEMRVKL